MPGGKHRFSKREDRMARHVADTYGGGKAALRIGYSVVNKRRSQKKRKGSR